MVIVSERRGKLDGIADAFRQAEASVDVVVNIRDVPPALMSHDVDLLVIATGAVENDALAFLREVRKLWPWLGIIAVGRRLVPSLRRDLAKLGVVRFTASADDYVQVLKLAREELIERTPSFIGKESYDVADFQYQLRVLRQVTEPALQALSLPQALSKLTEGLGRWIPASLVAMLGIGDDKASLVLRLYDSVAPSFIEEIRNTMVARYQQMSASQLEQQLFEIREGVKTSDSGPGAVGTSFSVPIVASGRLSGVLAVASAETQAYTDQSINFIYHAANHFSTVFSALARVRRLATRDPMTGLFNRYHLEQEYLAMARVCKRYHHSMAVVIVDIDHFKAVNDTYGHLVGDEVLCEFADVIRKETRESDVVGRYGGEEFVVLLPKGARGDALTYAERLREVVSGHVFVASSFGLKLTVSIGVAHGRPLVEDASEDFPLLLKADTAVYEAKKEGRNRIKLWTQELLPRKKFPLPSAEEFTKIAQRRKDSRILVVDDEPAVRLLLAKGLEMEGYECVAAANGLEALEILENAPYAYDVVVTDIIMDGLDGTELISRIAQLNSGILTIAISGKATVETAVESLRRGAYDFIEKPVRIAHLLATVRRALDYRAAMRENRRYQHHLSEMVQQKSAKLSESLAEVRRSYEFTLESLIGLLDAREKNFGEHSKRVRSLSVILAREMGLAEKEAETVGRGALLHDIGKIGVPDSILLKEAELTEQEWEIMRHHTETGHRILSASPYLNGVAEIVRDHHERYDGQGYPQGLSGCEICLGARIFAVVDAYDAMRSNRAYSPPKTPSEALAEIESGSGSQFDPQVVEVFKTCQHEIEQLFQDLQWS